MKEIITLAVFPRFGSLDEADALYHAAKQIYIEIDTALPNYTTVYEALLNYTRDTMEDPKTLVVSLEFYKKLLAEMFYSGHKLFVEIAIAPIENDFFVCGDAKVDFPRMENERND